MDMPDEQDKERSKISIRIGDAQVELEGTTDDIKKLMDKELMDFTKGMEGKVKQVPSSTEDAPKTTKTPVVAPKEKSVPPPSKPSAPASKTVVKAPPTSATGKAKGRMSKMKIMNRNAVIALVLVIALLVSLVSVIAIYVPMVNDLNSQIAEQDQEIASLNSQLSAIQVTLGAVAQNLTAKDNQIAALAQQVNTIADEVAAEYDPIISDYIDILGLRKSGSVIPDYELTQQTAGTSTAIWSDILEYPGYLKVDVESTSNTTYARVTYEVHEFNFDQNITVGESGTAVFAVLPAQIALSVGNTEPVDSVNATVTAIYVY
jgi:hypothetical protein